MAIEENGAPQLQEQVGTKEDVERSGTIALAAEEMGTLTILPVVEESARNGEGARASGSAGMPPPKPKPRAKVPLEKGFSQMVWMKLLKTEHDLAGLKGQSNKRLISMDEIKRHRTEDDAWTVLRGRVYNISPYIRFHPGGRDMIMKGAGKDCTSLFNKYHAWVNAEYLLEQCLVGFLEVTT